MSGTPTAAPRAGSVRLGQAGREILRRFEARTGVDVAPGLGRMRNRLHARASTCARDINQLKADVQELRGLGGRVAELTDLVTELLILAAKREDPEFQRLVTKYLEGV
jgi:hypothetical protein